MAAGRIVFSLVSSLFSFARLVGRLVGILCGLPLVQSCSSICWLLAARFARRLAAPSRQAARFSLFVLLIVPRCLVLPRLIVPVSFARIAWASRQAVRIFSFRSADRRAFRVFFVPHPVSLFSVLVSSRSLRFMSMMAAARLSHHVAACSHPVAPSWDPIGR